MRKGLTLLLAISISSPVHSQVNTWSRRYGDSGNQVTWRLAVDPSRNIFVTGDFEGQGDFGGGVLTSAGTDVFILKLDSDGNHLWSGIFGDAAMQRGYRIASDSMGNAILVGNSQGAVDFGNGPVTPASGGMFMVKFDPNGNLLWSFGFGHSQTHPFDVDVDAADNIIVHGSFTGSITLGGDELVSAGADDVFLAKFDTDGNHLWSRRFGSSGSDNGVRVAVDDSQHILAAGRIEDSVDFGGGPLIAPVQHVFVAKFDTDGNHVWSHGYGDPTSPLQSVQDIDTDTFGNVVFTGWFFDTIDFGGGPITATSGQDAYLAKLDPAGNHIWSHGFGADGDQFPGGLAIDPGGDVILAGSFSGSVDFGSGLMLALGTDVFIARFTALGNALGNQQFGDDQAQYVEGITIDRSGDFVIGGCFFGAIDFGTGGLVSADGLDGFVAKFGDGLVSVQVQDFSAYAGNGSIRLSWSLPEYQDVLGLRVQRSVSVDGPFADLTATPLVPARSMRFEDRSVIPGLRYSYRLLLLEPGGHQVVGPIITATSEEQPGTPALVVDYRGGDSASIRCRISAVGVPVGIHIYDVAGSQVRELEASMSPDQAFERDWDLRDESGSDVPNGMYFIQLLTCAEKYAARLLLVRR